MKFSISLIVGLVLGLTKISAQSLDYCEMKDVTFRKNLKDISDDEWNRYVRAVKAISRGNHLNTWDQYIKKHVDYYPLVHSTNDNRKPLFLAWHRLYLYYIEKELQKVDPSVTIPYWDWTIHNRRVRDDIAFSNKFFGGPATRSNSCIQNGSFKDMRVGVVHGAQGDFCIMRGWETYNFQFTDPDVLDTGYINGNTFEDFSFIEFNPHGNIHNSIGGQFSGHASPGDPLFYSHHAFIDKVWFDWQNRHVDKATDYTMPLSERIPPWNIELREVLDPFDRLCVAYKEEHFSWSGPNFNPNSRSAGLSANAVPEKYSVPKNVTDIKALEDFDKAYIKSGLMNVEMLRTETDMTPIPDPISAEFITKMNLDLSKFRELERRDAILLNSINQAKMF